MSKYDPALLEKAVRLVRQADSYSHGIEAVFDSLERAPWWEEVQPGYKFRVGEPYREENAHGNYEGVIALSTRSEGGTIRYFRDTRWTPLAPLAVGDVIDTVAGLERLPVGAIFTDADGDAWQQPEALVFKCIDPVGSAHSEDVVEHGPFTVRWLPEPEATK